MAYIIPPLIVSIFLTSLVAYPPFLTKNIEVLIGFFFSAIFPVLTSYEGGNSISPSALIIAVIGGRLGIYTLK